MENIEALDEAVAEANGGAEPPLSRLLASLAHDVSLLTRQQMALAKAEIIGKLDGLGIGAAMIAAAALLLFAGLLYLMAAAVLALALVLPAWAAALIVAGVALGVGGILAIVGKSRLRARSLVPERTIRSLREDALWAREQMR